MSNALSSGPKYRRYAPCVSLRLARGIWLIVVGKIQLTAIEYDWRSPQDFKSLPVQKSNGGATLSEAHEHRTRYRRRIRSDDHYSNEVDMALLRRRNVYRYQRYSLHVGSNPQSGFGNVSPDMIYSSTELQQRAKAWIRRELRAFDFSIGRTENLLDYIIEIIKNMEIKGGRAEELLVEHLGEENTPLFLHELSSWLRSPFDRVEGWDNFVQYGNTGRKFQV
jgi:hypothetical protein